MKYIFILSFLIVQSAYSQQCDLFPADCPDNDMLQQLAGKKWEGSNDLKVKEEYQMQDNLRGFITTMMEQLAQKKNWKYYLFQEEQESGIGIDGNTKPLPYSLRRPCKWGMDIVFIVNEDSLQTWKNWYYNDLQNASNAVISSFNDAAGNSSKDDIQKKYSDSANYYGNQKVKYMTEHAADYQKAILSNDSKAQKKYEDEMKRYDDKINACIDIANGRKQAGFASATELNKSLQKYRLARSVAYRNASLIRVRIIFNDYNAAAFDFTVSDPDKAAKVNKTTQPANIPNTAYSVTQHNHQPGNEWGQGTDLYLLLLGKWDVKYDRYYFHAAEFSKNIKNTDAVTIKKIPCDKVQSISIHAEGDPKFTSQFVQMLDIPALNKLITN